MEKKTIMIRIRFILIYLLVSIKEMVLNYDAQIIPSKSIFFF